MSKQFEKVDCRYGAPMGRPEILNDFSGKARCFKINLDSGGYDDGCCYWGFGSSYTSLYCATNENGFLKDGFLMFTRATNRKEAKKIFQERASILKGCKAIFWIN